MKSSPKTRNLGRKLSFQALEKRDLMAANVMASLSGSTLVIEGTPGNDNVAVQYDSRLGTTVYSSGRAIKTFLNVYNSIDAKMLDGSDRFSLQAYAHNNLESVAVNMGRGNSEVVLLNIGSTRNLNVNAKESVGTYVALNVNVRDQAFVDFGNDTGRDELLTGVAGRTASFNKLSLNMGAGSDKLSFFATSIQSLTANMGSDNDTIQADRNTHISSGVVDGASGSNDYFTKYGSPLNGIAIRGMEVVRNGY